MTIGHKPLQEGEVLDGQLHLLWLASLHRCTGQHQKQHCPIEADNLKLLQLLLCSESLMDGIEADCTLSQQTTRAFYICLQKE